MSRKQRALSWPEPDGNLRIIDWDQVVLGLPFDSPQPQTAVHAFRSKGSVGADLVGVVPRPQLFEDRARRQHVRVPVAPPDELHADGQSVDQPGRDGSGGVARKIGEV